MPRDTSRADKRAPCSPLMGSSSSHSHSSSDPSRGSRGRGASTPSRGSASRGRGRGGAAASAGGAVGAWQARREGYATIARENEDFVVPRLLKRSPSLAAAVNKTISYKSWPPATPVTPLEDGKTRFAFKNMDSIDAADELVKKWAGQNVAVLNMANAFKAGGGYIHGAAAQEEALCRRSTLYTHINHPKFYPFAEEGGLWSEGVRVFRAGEDELFEIFESEAQQFEFNVISVAAVEGPALTRDGQEYADKDDILLMLKKIVAILRIAKLHQQKAIVLGAFGCGAFRNPPASVASLFLRAFSKSDEFKDAFSEVTFAILDSGATSNLSTFTRVWKDVLEAQDAELGTEQAESPPAQSTIEHSAAEDDLPKQAETSEKPMDETSNVEDDEERTDRT